MCGVEGDPQDDEEIGTGEQAKTPLVIFVIGETGTRDAYSSADINYA